jgi:nicotinate phosphoribosyltransferase
MDLWESVYSAESGSSLYTSLTDTFSTDVFFREFKQRPDLVRRWKLRQDSGDPIAFVKKAKKMYDEMGVDPKEKPVVFSDSLNVEKAIKINEACEAAGMKGWISIPPSTFLTYTQQASA